ncbi:uncharacterized protein LOC129741935 isoform X2 [Uranotaenia lowii]|uniref:uncharacterized protein LOC129741935 isoform X2 n=1 Tax=Uranotaenia lowii TaxID=190385 RepID=UPI00247B00F2|nr:uncharacterized protein LOC129741935 isoform X2 [Uranotaenia lowii]
MMSATTNSERNSRTSTHHHQSVVPRPFEGSPTPSIGSSSSTSSKSSINASGNAWHFKVHQSPTLGTTTMTSTRQPPVIVKRLGGRNHNNGASFRLPVVEVGSLPMLDRDVCGDVSDDEDAVWRRRRVDSAKAVVVDYCYDGKQRLSASSPVILLGAGTTTNAIAGAHAKVIDDDQHQQQQKRWGWGPGAGSHVANIYENVPFPGNKGSFGVQSTVATCSVIASGCGEGAGYGKLRKCCEENIYENICEDCGRLYSTDKCAFCAVDEDEGDRSVARKPTINKYSAKFQEFFGNFRLKSPSVGVGSSVLGRSGVAQTKRKLSKSDIVHNVGGFEDVFRTNKSFDLGEICRMRQQQVQQHQQLISNSSSSDLEQLQHKRSYESNSSINNNKAGIDRVPLLLHKSDDRDRERLLVSSKATTPISPPSDNDDVDGGTKAKRSANLIDFSDPLFGFCDPRKLVYENLSFGPNPNRKQISERPSPELESLDGSIREWMTSLAWVSGAEDYECDEQEVTYHVKSIPSATFNDAAESGWVFPPTGVQKGERYHDPDRLRHKVEEYRQNIINNNHRCRRRPGHRGSRIRNSSSNINREEAKVDDQLVVITFRNSVFEDERDHGDDDSDCSDGTLTPTSVKVVTTAVGLHRFEPENPSIASEDRSDFVCGLLNIFDAVLSREKKECNLLPPPSSPPFLSDQSLKTNDNNINTNARSDVISSSSYRTSLPQQPHPQVIVVQDTKLPPGSNCLVVTALSVNKQQPLRRSEICRRLARERLLTLSLCRVVLGNDPQLKIFLLVKVLKLQVGRRKLVLNRRKTYLNLITMTSSSSSQSQCQQRSGSPANSALCEAIRIDQYFQFLEGNETMINLAISKRRRRRKADELINPDLQSNSSNEISCGSTTSGINSDSGVSLMDENIYQQIWTCKTDGSEPTAHESPQEHIYDYIKLHPPQDESEWEVVVDDFAFSKRRTHLRPAPPIPNRNIRHPLDQYRNVCILYNPTEPKVNQIIYDYRRDYIFNYGSCTTKVDDESSKKLSNQRTSSHDSLCEADEEEDVVERASFECDDSCCPDFDYDLLDDDDGESLSSSSCPHNNSESITKDRKPANTSNLGRRNSYCPYSSIPDCVQYWKFMLLNVHYNEDEEDVIMTEKTLAVISENIEQNLAPLRITLDDDQHHSSLRELQPKQFVPHHPLQQQPQPGPKFGSPTARSKPDVPFFDSCPGTYTSKSIENLPDVLPPVQVAQQEKEKSPNPKRERFRDKMKSVLPLSSSRSDEGLVFGVELEQVERDEKLQVPRFMVECVEILKEPEYMCTSGLYRASGNKNSIETIKKKMNERRSPKKYDFLKKQDVHSLTGSLKLFFRELKSPLIPKDIYEMCVRKTKDEAETIENIRRSVEKMELINRNTLRYLIRHLRCVHQNSDTNMMNSSNLAIVWGACLFSSTQGLMESYENNDLGRINTLLKLLVDHYDRIFYGDTANVSVANSGADSTTRSQC